MMLKRIEKLPLQMRQELKKVFADASVVAALARGIEVKRQAMRQTIESGKRELNSKSDPSDPETHWVRPPEGYVFALKQPDNDFTLFCRRSRGDAFTHRGGNEFLKNSRQDYAFITAQLMVRKTGERAGEMHAHELYKNSLGQRSVEGLLCCVVGEQTKIEVLPANKLPKHIVNEQLVKPISLT